MRCDHKLFESAVSDLVEWHIPDDWGTCHVHVYGDTGTTFDVLLLPPTWRWEQDSSTCPVRPH